MGEGPKETVDRLLARASERGIGDRVKLVPFDANPFKYVARAQVYALSSLWEGSPIVLKEALACGCPSVATDCPFGPWDREAIELLRTERADVLRRRSLDFDLDVTIAQYEALIVGLLD